jgi:TPR repeat protein
MKTTHCRVRAARSSAWRTTVSSITSLLTQMSAPRLKALFAQEPQRAAQWVYVAAAEGLPQAQLCYGRMLLEGTGVPKDSAKALAWFRRAAASGDMDAVNMVGRCFDNGWGTTENPAAAAEQYRRAAEAGHGWAQYNLGHLYLDGRGVQRDADRAFAYYLRAAQQGHERAMSLAGRCCEEGWGTPRDPVAAADWYRRSAEAGYFRGQYNWASVLLGAGRAEEAAVWFERAAMSGPPSVRQAVLKVTAVADAGGALADLAARLRVHAAT